MDATAAVLPVIKKNQQRVVARQIVAHQLLNSENAVLKPPKKTSISVLHIILFSFLCNSQLHVIQEIKRI